MSSTYNLITDPRVREDRQVQKESAVLKFLRQQIWSEQVILQQVMSLQSRQATHKALTKMEKKGYLHRHSFDALGGKLTIWGITHQGQMTAFDPQSESFVSAYFEPSRVSEQAIRHELDLQKLRLIAESSGWVNWIDGNRLNASGKDYKRPDSVVTDTKGKTVACECERTYKSIKRYQQILVHYLMAIKAGEIDYVVWICPTSEMTLKLKLIITSIKEVRVAGQRVLIEPERHHRNLHFCSYQDWSTFCSKQEQ